MDDSAAATAVVLVHGLWMRGVAMALLAARLRRRGFRTLTPSYPSIRRNLDDNADRLADAVAAFGRGSRSHLVGHSLGGLLILLMLARHPDLPVARVVLLGAPVRGSGLARRLDRQPLLRWLVGESMADWQRAPRPRPATAHQIAVIAGNRALGSACCFPDFPSPHDGNVAVSEAQLDGLPPPLVLPVNHSGMLISRSVAEHVAGFLADGRL